MDQTQQTPGRQMPLINQNPQQQLQPNTYPPLPNTNQSNQVPYVRSNNQPMQSYNQPYSQPYIQPMQLYNPNNHQVIVSYQNHLNTLQVQSYAISPICPICRKDTASVTEKTAGGVTWSWCFVLFLFTGICCCIPFCVDSCQDTEIKCSICRTVKTRIPANCC